MLTTLYVVLSIGQNRSHIYKGNIWHVSRSHPLLPKAVHEVLRTENTFTHALSPTLGLAITLTLSLTLALTPTLTHTHSRQNYLGIKGVNFLYKIATAGTRRSRFF